MYSYILGENGPPTWMGFAMLKADGVGLADELTCPDSSPWPTMLTESSEYRDSRGRRWCLLSRGYENSAWGGLVELHGESSLAIRKRSLKATFDSPAGEADMHLSLDPAFADQPYTPELYESACHLLGKGATWRLNTGKGYRCIRLHLVDWWHGPAKSSSARPTLEFRIHAGCQPERHVIHAPQIGFAKVLEFVVHVEDRLGQLEIEIRRCDHVGCADSSPCFCGFEVLQTCKQDFLDYLQATKFDFRPHTKLNFQTTRLHDMPRLLDSTVPRPRKNLKVGYLRRFEKWLPSR